jgi:hypothetical protein
MDVIENGNLAHADVMRLVAERDMIDNCNERCIMGEHNGIVLTAISKLPELKKGLYRMYLIVGSETVATAIDKYVRWANLRGADCLIEGYLLGNALYIEIPPSLEEGRRH